MSYRFAAGLVLAVSFGLSACSSTPADQRFATVDGHQVAYRLLGEGAPTVVMISGLGDGMASFKDVAPDLAQSATVIVYDRAGYGGSERVDGPKGAAEAEAELAGVLAQSGAKGPYVLIGHSIGGMFAEYYAARNPEQIAGLVLEDSRPAEFTRLCEAAGLSMCTPPPLMAKLLPAGGQAEFAALEATSAAIEAAGPVSGKPALVLSRPVGAKPMDVLWASVQDDLAARYPGSVHLSAAGGGHYIHVDQRDWYLDALSEFLSLLR